MTRCMVWEVVSVICDDTDVFALLLHVVAEMKPNGLLCMCSTVKDRAVIDIMQSVKVHTSIVPDLLVIHALTGAHTSAATFGIGKIRALKVARTARLPLHDIGDTQADEAIVLEQAASFILACHGKGFNRCASIREARIKMWILILVLLWNCAVHLPPRHLLKIQNVLHIDRHQLRAQCPLSMPWRMVGSTTDTTWSPRLCQREPCLPQLLSWRWCDMGAHLVVKEATVNVAPWVVLLSVHAREVRCAWTCSQRNRKNQYLLMMIMMMMMNCSWISSSWKHIGQKGYIKWNLIFYHYNSIKCKFCSMLHWIYFLVTHLSFCFYSWNVWPIVLFSGQC